MRLSNSVRVCIRGERGRKLVCVEGTSREGSARGFNVNNHDIIIMNLPLIPVNLPISSGGSESTHLDMGYRLSSLSQCIVDSCRTSRS